MAHIAAISSLTPVLDRFDSPRLNAALQKAGSEPWDFFVTAACVFIALNSLLQREGADRAAQLDRLVFEVRGKSTSPNLPKQPSIEGHMEQFHQTWRLNGRRAVEDCAAFVNRSVSAVAPKDRRAALLYALGSWVLWNVFGEAPSSDESSMAVGIGNLAAESFAGYWD
jgi:hypothetical protein